MMCLEHGRRAQYCSVARVINTNSNIRSLRVAKLSPLDFDDSVALKSCLPDFGANVLPLSITISPDK